MFTKKLNNLLLHSFCINKLTVVLLYFFKKNSTLLGLSLVKKKYNDFSKNLIYVSVNREVLGIVKNVELFNSELIIKQNLLFENYGHFITSNARNFPTVRFKFGSSLYTNSLQYNTNLCKKDFLSKDFKIIKKRRKNIPLNFTSELHYNLDVWGENYLDRLITTFEFKRIIQFYKTSIKQKKYETVSDYWDLYLQRLDLELQKKKLKRQKYLMFEYHYKKYSNRIQYEDLLQSILDFKIQINYFKQNINNYTKRVKFFLKKNNLDIFYIKNKTDFFTFKNLKVNLIWKFFLKINLTNFKSLSILNKNKNLKNFQFNVMKENIQLRKSIIQKLPQFEFLLNYEREYSDNKDKVNNLKNNLSKINYIPKDNIFVGFRFFFNVFDGFFNFGEKIFHEKKLERLHKEFIYKNIIELMEQEFFFKKTILLSKEIKILKTRLLINSKIFLYQKKIFEKSQFENKKWRDFEIIYLQSNILFQKKIFEYLKLVMYFDLTNPI